MPDNAVSGATRDHAGGCQCGAVRYTARGLRDIWFCHCRQCRRMTGHYMAACRTERDRLTVTGEVRWTPVSERAQQGSCAQCGSQLFWRNTEFDTVSVIAGSLETTTGIEVRGHIFVAEKGDYYQIADDLPRHDRHPPGGC